MNRNKFLCYVVSLYRLYRFCQASNICIRASVFFYSIKSKMNTALVCWLDHSPCNKCFLASFHMNEYFKNMKQVCWHGCREFDSQQNIKTICNIESTFIKHNMNIKWHALSTSQFASKTVISNWLKGQQNLIICGQRNWGWGCAQTKYIEQNWFNHLQTLITMHKVWHI